jgi:transcriptional regulator with XRE-family HTH domain
MPQTRDRAARKTPLDHDPPAVVWARKAKGVSQTWLAKEVGISSGHMSEIESGSRNAPPHLLNKLATALNCPVTVLERKRQAED